MTTMEVLTLIGVLLAAFTLVGAVIAGIIIFVRKLTRLETKVEDISDNHFKGVNAKLDKIITMVADHETRLSELEAD